MDLESRFKGIDKKKYYLSYSGGKDSHFLYWFIKEWLKDDEIEIVSCNTYLEHDEIMKRMYRNADTILLPKMRPFDIKEKYGIPCFSKVQDDWIDRYQRGSRADYLMKRIRGNEDGNWTKFKLNNKARELLLNGNLHRISPKCCRELKKKPFHEYERKCDKKPILGVRGTESVLRGSKYKTCFTKEKRFAPIHDMSDEMLEKIQTEFNIDVPEIYDHIGRTGCAGCPYGSWKKETTKELNLLNENKRKFVCQYFKESYEVLGININTKQERLF